MFDEGTVYDHIIWSADVPDVQTLTSYLDQMPKLRIAKIDRLFVARNGYAVFDVLHNRGLRVFNDAKLVEIPSKLEELAKVELQYQPWMLNCMAGAVSNGNFEDDSKELDGLKRFADACHAAGTLPCGVTVLTSKTPNVVSGEFNDRDSVSQVWYYVHQLVEAGFTDVVCSPAEVTTLRKEYPRGTLELNTPGIRPAGSVADDQARTDTPAAALRNGVTRLVIGRPITNGPGTPGENLDAIAAEILAA